MSTPKLKVIVKVSRHHGISEYLLFFPESKTNFGRIEGWESFDGHFEADMGWYRSLANPDAEDTHVDRILARYHRLYSRPAEGFELVRVWRDSDKMRKARWTN